MSSPFSDNSGFSNSDSPGPGSDFDSQYSNFSNDLHKAFDSICKQRLVEEIDKLKETVQKDNPDPNEVIMAIPMLLALTICPAMLGTQEAIRQSQSKTKREEHRGRRCNLVVSCVKPSIRSRDINNKLVVLKDNKLYIANEVPIGGDSEGVNSASRGYPFSGYFLPYPDAPYEGLVSTISDDPPMLNWIYVDKDTYEVKYGVRVDAQPHHTGPFDCTKQDRRMTLESWEGFCAVEEIPGLWALYFDRDDDGLLTKVPMGTRVLEVELTRREKKERKPEPDPEAPQTMDEKMKQHKAQTAQEEKEREEFMQQVSNPTGDQPTEAAAPQATENKVESATEDMRRLSVDGSAAGTYDEAATYPPSVWSEKNGARDDVTTASSIGDHNEAVPAPPASPAPNAEEEPYKKPYVEEV